MKKLEEEERKPRSGSLFRPREKRGSISGLNLSFF